MMMNGVRNMVDRLLMSYGGSSVPDSSEASQQRPYRLLLVWQQASSSSFSAQHEDGTQQQSSHSWPEDTGKLWLEYIATIVLSQHVEEPPVSSESSTTNESIHHAPSLVFLETLPAASKMSTAQYLQSRYGATRVQRMPIDPLGWMEDEEEGEVWYNSTPKISLERLDTIITAVESVMDDAACRGPNCPCVLMMDSVTPILMRHGFDKTTRFLQELLRTVTNRTTTGNCRLVVIPIRNEMFTVQQRRFLEDYLGLDAILNVPTPWVPTALRGQHSSWRNAVLLRRGVRESDHVQRESIPYGFRIVTTDHASDAKSYPTSCRYEIAFFVGSNTSSGAKDDSTTDVLVARFNDHLTLGNSVALPSQQQLPSVYNSGKSHGVVHLQLHEGDRRTFGEAVPSPQKPPHIFMQDDDPEFDDYDEEDPDDDLDI